MTDPVAEAPRAARAGGSQWADVPERGSERVLRAGVWVALRIGRAWSLRLLHIVAAYFFLFAPPVRRSARGYLRRVLGREPTARDRYRQVYYFATTVLDRLYLLNGRYDLFELTLNGGPLMYTTLAQGAGAFLLGSHLGSFAMVSSVGHRRTDLRVAMAMYEAQAGPLTTLFNVTHARAAPEIIFLGHVEAMLRIRDCLSAGKFVGLLADRTLRDAPAVALPFLGSPALFPTGPMRVAAALRRPVFFMTGLYRGGNRYHVVFEQVADFSAPAPEGRAAAVRAAVVRYAQLLEHYTRSDPYNWFNFYDFWHGAVAAAGGAA